MSVRAVWNGEVIAESSETVIVEGNHYFPSDSIKAEFLSESSRQTVCPWKGLANYYDITVEGKVNRGGAWIYKTPSQAAAEIKDHVAFWQGIRVERSDS
jgi:uncharacterized protein (DUF427 family)